MLQMYILSCFTLYIPPHSQHTCKLNLHLFTQALTLQHFTVFISPHPDICNKTIQSIDQLIKVCEVFRSLQEFSETFRDLQEVELLTSYSPLEEEYL